MKRSGIKRGKGPKRHKPLPRGRYQLQRRTRLAPVNRARKADRFAEHFGSEARVAWVNEHPCVCRGRHPACAGPTVNAHETSRGAGGTSADIVPMSQGCHDWQHAHGILSWCAAAGLTRAQLKRIAARMAGLGPDAPLGGSAP